MYQDLESSKSNAQPIIDPLLLHVILSNSTSILLVILRNSTSIHCCSTLILPHIQCPNNRLKNINNIFFFAQGSLFGLGFLNIKATLRTGVFEIELYIMLDKSYSNSVVRMSTGYIYISPDRRNSRLSGTLREMDQKMDGPKKWIEILPLSY
jgi:hypothetical protein